MVSSVSIRLGTTGAADVKSTFGDIADSGDASAKRLVASYDRATDAIAKSTEQQANAAAKIAAIMPSPTQATVNASVGTGYNPSQNANAAQYAALLVQQERQVEAVRAAIDPLYTAQKRYDEELATAAALLSRRAISEREYAAAVDLSTAAFDRAKAAEAGRSYSTGPDANAHVVAFNKANTDQAAAADRLRAAINPLYSAQKQYDQEIETANGLLKAGAISEAEHAAAVGLSERALKEAKAALDGHSGAMGLNRAQTITAQSAVLRFTDSIIAGRNPLTAFALEAHKGVEVLGMDDGGLAGGFAKVAEFANPATLAIAGVTAVLLIGAGAWLSYEDAMAKLDNIARGAGAAIGATGQDLEASAEAAASHGALTVAAAREIETGYVQMGGIGKDVLGNLTALTADFAAATGTDAKAAQETLGKAFQDPIKGAEELAARYGFLTQAQVEQIAKTEEANGIFAAQAQLFDDLNPHVDEAAKHLGLIQSAWQAIKNTASEAKAAMGAAIDEAITGGAAVDRLKGLQATKGKLLAIDPNADTSAYDKQIALIQAQFSKANEAAGSKLAQDALSAGSGYSGYDQKQALIEARDRIKNDLSNADAVKQLAGAGNLDKARAELEAYTHAIDTFLPAAEKKRQLDLADVAIAQARAKRDPAALASASSRKEEIEQSGQLVTQADVEADALAKGERARARLDGAADKHAATLGREAAAMTANTQAAMAAAQAYLTGGAASGQEEEARRKAVTDATKKGTDIDPAVRRQLANSVADEALAGAKSISTLLQESAARRQVNADVEDGKTSIDDMSDALSDEQALRALTVAQTLAQKKGLTDFYTQITAEIEKYKTALQEAHDVASDSDFLKAMKPLQDGIDDSRLRSQYAGDRTGGYDRAKALADANREADAKHFSPDQRATDNVMSVLSVNTKQSADATVYADQTLNSQKDATALSQQQLTLLTASADKRELMVALLQKEQDLTAHLIPLDSARGQAILAGVAAQVKVDEQVKASQASMDALRQDGDKFIDDVFNPKGDGLKNLLKDAKQQLEEMALINPLKNLLGGEHLPTLGGLFGGGGGSSGGGLGKLLGGAGGLLKRIFGGGSGIGASIDHGGLPDQLAIPNYDFASSLFHFAAGSEYTPAGPAWVGENGPEIVNLPGGSKVTNAADTRRLMSAGNDNGGTNNHFHLEGAVVTQDLVDQMNAIGSRATVRGATGGARLASDNLARSRRRSLSNA